MLPVPALVALSRAEVPRDNKGAIELCPQGTLDQQLRRITTWAGAGDLDQQQEEGILLHNRQTSMWSPGIPLGASGYPLPCSD